MGIDYYLEKNQNEEKIGLSQEEWERDGCPECGNKSHIIYECCKKHKRSWLETINFYNGGWMKGENYKCKKCLRTLSCKEYNTYVIDSGGYDFPWTTHKTICKKCEGEK